MQRYYYTMRIWNHWSRRDIVMYEAIGIERNFV